MIFQLVGHSRTFKVPTNHDAQGGTRSYLVWPSFWGAAARGRERDHSLSIFTSLGAAEKPTQNLSLLPPTESATLNNSWWAPEYHGSSQTVPISPA